MTTGAIHPRHPIAAALLSLALPGLGQLYNGEINKALWLFITFVSIGVPGMTIAALYVPAVLMLPVLLASVLLTLTIWLGSVVSAWRVAARAQVYQRQEWQTSGLYALLLLTGNLFIAIFLIGTMRDRMVQSFFIPSASMEPGILRGDVLFADKRYNCPGCGSRVERGDVGIFVYPNDRTQYYIKRVIGLPGDHIVISGHAVSINGVSLTRNQTEIGGDITATEQSGGHTWQVHWNASAAGSSTDLVVPPGQIFLLGDNRGLSSDSRQFGSVPMVDLKGKARQLWFSRGKTGVRWSRLGMVLK